MRELETPRLRLRNFVSEDLDRLAQLTSDTDFMRFSGGQLFSREKAAAFLERLIAPTRLCRPSQFALILCETGTLLGYCGFFRQTVDGVEEWEIAYRLDPKFWNRGLATEAAQAVRDHAFRNLQLARVISLVHPDNLPSRRVAEKIGMQLEKETVFRGFPALVFALNRPPTKTDC